MAQTSPSDMSLAESQHSLKTSSIFEAQNDGYSFELRNRLLGVHSCESCHHGAWLHG